VPQLQGTARAMLLLVLHQVALAEGVVSLLLLRRLLVR
jgi:hypothetical protein